MNDQKLTDRVAIITGSDSGIGQATAIEFAREGADVVVTWHEDEKGAKETVRGVEEAGRRALLLHLDVKEESEIESVFDDALAAFGHVDILMNNASIDSTGNQIADIALDDWDRAIRTNLTGPMLCSRRFINERRKAGGGGKIINVTSVHDEIPRVGAAEYCASKGGLQNLDPLAGPGARAGPDQREQHRSRHGADTDEPGGPRRSRHARGAGPVHSLEAGRQAGGDRPTGRLPRLG